MTGNAWEIARILEAHVARVVSISTPLFGKAKLMIEGRDRTKLIDGLDR